MTTERDSKDSPVIQIPECENVETIPFDEALFQAFQVPPMEPLQPEPRGMDIRVRVPSSETANQYACVEIALAPNRMGPTPHEHEYLDELCFVLAGTLSVLVEDEVYEIPAGGMQWRPRGRVHSFWNATDEPVCFLDMSFNQNFDEYLEALFALRETLSRNGPEFDERKTELDREFGITWHHDRRETILDRHGLQG